MEREGEECKPVTASLLLTAPGLGDSTSLCFPCCRFNSFSISAFTFISCFLFSAFDRYIAIIFAFPDPTIYLLKFGLSCLTEFQGGRSQRTVLKLGLRLGLGLFFMLQEWISLLLCCECFLRSDRRTEKGVTCKAIGPHTSTTSRAL